MHADPLGQALLEVHQGQKAPAIVVRNRYGSDEDMDPHYLFRSYADMPELEKQALERAEGKILDIGAGAGSHTLCLQVKELDVTALELSPGACLVMKQRGVKQLIRSDFWKHEQQYNTILMLMNGIGLVGDLKGLRIFFKKLKKMLLTGGQLIFDSCDVAYVYDDIPLPSNRYYGEVEFQMIYKQEKGPWFKWLYIDPVLMKWEAEKAGFEFEMIGEDSQFQYLASLSVKDA